MKKVIFIAALFISYLSFGQKVGADVIKFQGNVTSTVRDTYDVPTGEYWLIYNTTTDQLEVSDDTDSWGALSGATDDQTAAEVAFTPYSTIASTDVQAAIQEVLDEATSGIASGDIDTSAEIAAIVTDETGTGNLVFSASPTFTGTPVLPSTFTIGANNFVRSGAHGLTLTTSGTTSVTLPTSGTLATRAGAETLTNKTITFAGNTLTNVMSLTTAQSVNAGIKKTFQANGTSAGLGLAGVTSNPSSLTAGDIWYRSDSEKMTYRGASGARSLVAESLAQTLTNKTIDADNNTISNIGSAEITDGSISVSDFAPSSAYYVLKNNSGGTGLEYGPITTESIQNGTILATDLSATNGETDNYIPTYDNASGGFTWVDPATIGGGVSDGDKGDITISSSGTVWAIDDNLTLDAADYTVDASGFSGNLTTGDDTLQEIADALDALSTSGSTQEEIEDYAGAMFSGNTETLITATYQDGDGTIDLVVDDDLSNYDNSTSDFITSDPTVVTNGVQITNIVAAPTADIEAIGSPDANTLYVPNDASSYGLPNQLPLHEVETSVETTYVADETAVGVLNVVDLDGPLGTYYVEIPEDGTYEHPIGTILHFWNAYGNEKGIRITFESPATGPTLSPDTAGQIDLTGGYVSIIKYDDDNWIIYDERSSGLEWAYPQVTLSNITDAITTGDGAGYWIAPADGYFSSSQIGCFVQMTDVSSGSISVEFNKDGSDISTTEMTTDSGETSSRTATTPHVLSDYYFSQGTVYRFDITTAPTGGYRALMTLKVHYFE